MLSEFRTQLERDYPDLQDRRLLLACSGGLDSMVLLHLLRACDLEPSVAHCNFKLRGAASDADARFVREHCASLGIRYFEREFPTKAYADEHRGSVQMAARKLRYDWFRELMQTEGFDFLLTAHHLDDQVETFLINLSRGSGIQGLSGIPSGEQQIIRPLLSFPRTEIEAYAKINTIEWREDQSNADTKYLRNQVRHEILPKLREMHPAFDQNVTRSLQHLKGSTEMLQHYRDSLVDRLFTKTDTGYRVPIRDLAALDPLHDHLYLLFSPYGFTDPGAVERLFEAGNSKGLYSHTHRLLKDREQLIVAPVPSNSEARRTEDLESQGIQVEEVHSLGAASTRVMYVDKEKLNGPLYLKKWGKGDYFYPFGMQGRQKLAKYFKDHKFDPVKKEQQWLLCSGEDIVWIVGHRADDRFRVDEKTRAILKITCT